MKTINIQFHFKDSFKRVPPKYFKTDDMKTATEICENGIDNGYIVLINGNKYKAMSEFGKTIKLNDA
tara:strand:- start:261 stop:461 length:201 start_codon:yes stop_codon:yes gene_type:complete